MKIRPKKALGQNFLVDGTIAKDLAEAAELKNTDTVLEVGAGTGTVTRELAKNAGRVVAVEFDRDLIPELKSNLQDLKNVEIINSDILKVDLQELGIKSFKIAGAIPYQITSPLIHQILHSPQRPGIIALIVQKEVAEKIAAQPPKATYLSQFVSNFGEAQILKIIKPAAFNPPPQVDSAILKITLFENPRIANTYRLEKMLHHGFLQPRKMIRHRFPAEVLKEKRIDPASRPAHLTKENWQNLYERFEKGKNNERKKDRRGGGVWIKSGA